MIKRPAALTATLAAFALAGCSPGLSTSSQHALSVPARAPARPAAAGAAMFGTPKRVPDARGHTLIVTPVKAWWLLGDIQSRRNRQAAAEGISPAENGRFLIIEMKVQAASGTAYFPAPIAGGPAIISHHQMFSDAGTSASDNVVWNTCLPYTDSNVPLRPGTWLVDSQTYDVPPGPAVLEWLAGAEGASTASWRVPPQSTGPLAAKVQAALRTGNGC